MVFFYCLRALPTPMSMERHCPLGTREGGGGNLLNFIVIILSEELCCGAAFGTMCSWISNVGTYVHSIEHALGRERSDRCSREKVLRSISLGKDLRRRE